MICLMVAKVVEREVGSMSVEPSPTPGNSSMASPSSPVASDGLWSPTDANKLEIAVSLSFLVGVIQVINNVVPVFPRRMLSCYLRTPSTTAFLFPYFCIVSMKRALVKMSEDYGYEVPLDVSF